VGKFVCILTFIKHLYNREAHCLARTNDGRLFGWGSNKYGQLGVNSVEQPSIATPTEIRSVWTLPNSTYAPSKSLTVANNNSSSSELKITHIAAGDHSSYVVQSSAEQVSLISFGCGQQGQLGNGMNVQMTAAPVRIKSLSYLYQYDDHRKSMVPIAIERVYAGARHAIAVLGTGDGLVFGKDLLGWGSNLAGECGTGVKGGSISTPTNVTAGVAVSDRRQIFLANALPASSANGKGLRGWFGREKSAQNTERYSETVACGDQTTCIYQTC
jgi:alpha-tubulin suppressor-like RCC1 family protein